MTKPTEGQKRIPKNPIHFKVSLDEEQKKAKALILEKDITIVMGQPGTGKSLLISQIALDLLFTHQVKKIIVTRPIVTVGEDLGFLPGDKEAKLAPYIEGVLDHMIKLCGEDKKILKMIEEREMEVGPIGFVRGRNFENAVVICEEAQNATDHQLKALQTRICPGTKLIFSGDLNQVDLKHKEQSGFPFMIEHLSKLPGYGLVELFNNHRLPIVRLINDTYKKYGK